MTDHSIDDSKANEIIDLEKRAQNEHPNNDLTEECASLRQRRYQIRIDSMKYIVDVQSMTGRELLNLAGKQPPERYQIFQKPRGGILEEISLVGKVDFSRPGIERFVTLPLD